MAEARLRAEVKLRTDCAGPTVADKWAEGPGEGRETKSPTNFAGLLI